jgi:hypothetical protein
MVRQGPIGLPRRGLVPYLGLTLSQRPLRKLRDGILNVGARPGPAAAQRL